MNQQVFPFMKDIEKKKYKIEVDEESIVSNITYDYDFKPCEVECNFCHNKFNPVEVEDVILELTYGKESKINRTCPHCFAAEAVELELETIESALVRSGFKL